MDTRYTLNLTIKQGISTYGQAAVESVVKEFQQHIKQGTFQPVHVDELHQNERRLIIPSKTFLKVKYSATGEFDKLKARNVAGGHLMDRELYDNIASPTAATASVVMIASITAKENRAVYTIDFPGAFLNSIIPDDRPPVFMRLNK